MEVLEMAYDGLLTGALLFLALLVIAGLIRSVLGPKISDRIIAVNMMGTMVIMVIAILSVYLDENYLADVCLIYAMISFLGVVVLCKVYTGVYLHKKQMLANLEAVEDNLSHQEKKDMRNSRERREAEASFPTSPGETGKEEESWH